MEILRSILLCDTETCGSRRQRVLHWVFNLAAMTLYSLFLCIAALVYASPEYDQNLFTAYITNPATLILNFVPILMVELIFFLISNRVWISSLITLITVSVPSLINYFKLSFRGDPLKATDIFYLSEAANMGGNYNIRFTAGMIVLFLLAAGFIAASVFFLRARVRAPLVRAVWLVSALFASFILYRTAYTSVNMYYAASNMDVIMDDGAEILQWSDTNQYLCHGFIYPFIYSTRELSDAKPEGYTKAAAKESLSSYPYGDISDDEKVSVVSIMLEAYNDFSAFDSVELKNDPYAFLHSIQEESVSGRLVTNIFSGGTIDTERAFLTGSTKLSQYRKTAASFVRYFDEQGYTTTFCHPSYSWFYNRQNVCENLGFDHSWFFESRYTLPDDWGFLGDAEFFSDLIDLFEENTADGSPYFNFNVTYQNHGPYSDEELYSDTEYVGHDGLSDEAYTIFNNYLYGIDRTGSAMSGLMDYFRGSEEPVVLVFFGDHNPWLGDDSFVYDELGIDISRQSTESFLNYYCTPYVIWANDAAKEILENDFTGDGGDISPCFLMSKLFELCSWEGDEFMQASMALGGMASVVHESGVVWENGDFTAYPSEELSSFLKKYEYMQYFREKDQY